MKTISLLLLFVLTGCATGATLRTARALEQGEVEFSGGVAALESRVTQVVIGGVGLGKGVDLELRWEDQFIAFTPRLQLLKSECAYIDCLTFFETGYSEPHGLQWGPGLIVGRRFCFLEPYASYRYRHFSDFREKNLSIDDAHYVKCGTRLYISHFIPFIQKCGIKLFIDGEVGPTFSGGTHLEWAANIGFCY